MEYGVVTVSGPVEALPLVAVLVVQALVAVQEVALVEIQDSKEVSPEARYAGVASRLIAGNGSAVTVVLPKLDK
jgi:hypothetical protein